MGRVRHFPFRGVELLGLALGLAAFPAPAVAQEPPPPTVAPGQPGPPDGGRTTSVAELRRLIGAGQPEEAEARAQAQLAGAPLVTRADSLRYYDVLWVFVEARLRQGKSTESATRPAAERLVSLGERVLGPGNPDLASGLDCLGFVLRDLRELRGAWTQFDRAMHIREARLATRHPEVAKSLSNLATVCFAMGDYARAKPLLERALSIDREELPPDDPNLAATMNNLALARSMLGDTTQVRAFFEQARHIWEKRYGDDAPQVAFALHNLGAWELTRGEYAQSGSMLDQALAIREKWLPGQTDLAATLRERARLRLVLGDAEAARPLLERARDIFVHAGGPEDPDATLCMVYLGQAEKALGDYAKAEELNVRALDILERTPGPDSLNLSLGLQSLGSLCLQIGDPVRALSLLDRALAIQVRHYGPDHVEVALALAGSAAALRAMARFDSAGARYQRSLGIIERNLGSEHVLMAEPLLGLAGLAREAGDLARARSSAEQALAVLERALGPRSPKVAECLHLLGVLSKSLGEVEEAKISLDQAREILQAGGRGSQTELAAVFNSLGVVERQRGRPREAQEFFQRGLAISQGNLGAERENAAVVLRNLGSLANESGDYRAGDEYFRRALAIRESEPNRLRPELGSIMVGLGNALRGLDRDEEARVLYRQALEVQQRAFSPDHPALAIGFHNLAASLLEGGQLAAALDTALRAEQITRRQFKLVARGLAQREALHFAATCTRGLDIAMTAAARLRSDEASRRTWDEVIRSRALVLDEMAERRRTVATARDPVLKQLDANLKAASARLASLTVVGRGSLPADRYRALLEQAQRDMDAAERALAARSEPFRRVRGRDEIGMERVSAALPKDAALVGYVRYVRFEEARGEGRSKRDRPASGRRGTPAYAAFVLQGPGGTPRLVDLGPATLIDSRIKDWQLEAANGLERNPPDQAEPRYREVAAALRAAVWDSVSGQLGDAKRVFVVPDGALQIVNLSTLPDASDGYLVETGPLLLTLSAERDLVSSGSANEPAGGLLTTAAVDFDRPSAGLAAPGDPPAGKARTRGAQCTAFRALWFDSLPATRIEERTIVSLWKRYHARLPGAPASGRATRQQLAAITELLGPGATERAFKAQARGQSVLHIATHGFFLGGECSGMPAEGEGPESEESAAAMPVKEESPLLLSGLAFAGANRRGDSSRDDEDGILTAEEIAAMDLSAVDWAVLSACETGLGEVRAGEGVFGLRRAFQIAGARTLIMTLWAVEDRSAAEWMGALYEHRLKQRKSTAEAVREASLEVLRRRRSEEHSGHPHYWGAFVSAGGWN